MFSIFIPLKIENSDFTQQKKYSIKILLYKNFLT